MNQRIFGKELANTELQFANSFMYRTVERSRVVTPDVLEQLGQLKIDYIYEDEDLNETAVLLYKDKANYDLKRGSTIRFILNQHGRKIVVRVARGVDIDLGLSGRTPTVNVGI